MDTNPLDLAAAVASAKVKKSNQRQRTKLEQKRQNLLSNLRSASVAEDADLSLAPNKPSNTMHNVVGGPFYMDKRLSQVNRTFSEGNLKMKATKAVDEIGVVMNPAKPSLTDVARMYLQDNGETAGRELLPKEKEFVKDAHEAGTYINKVEATFRDVSGAIERRLNAMEQRRRQAANHMVVMSTEHVTYTQYQKYMRKKGFLQDEREEVPEGNLIPILAILQGEAESIGFIKAKRTLVRIGDFVVEIDPDDPLFARFDGGAEAKAEEERRRNFQLYRNGKFKDADTQTGPRDDDATDAEIAFVYTRLDECQGVIEAMDKSKLDAELFVDTALSRIVGLRNTVVKMYDSLERGQAVLLKYTTDAMAQNERLWKKLEAVATEGQDAKAGIKQTFTQQIDHLSSLNLSLKLRMEKKEEEAMKLCEDYHYQEVVHVQKMDDLRKQILPKSVKDELQRLQTTVEISAREEAGGPSFRATKERIEAKIEHLSTTVVPEPPARSPISPTTTPTTSTRKIVLPFKLLPALKASIESAFSSVDELAFEAQRNVIAMMSNPHQPALVTQHITDVRELSMELRKAVGDVCNEFVDTVLETVIAVQEEKDRELAVLQQRITLITAQHEDALKQQEAQITAKFQKAMENVMPLEELEKEKRKAAAKEKERLMTQIGKEIPIPALSIPFLPPSFPVPKALMKDAAQLAVEAEPQDLLHAAANYFTELIMEVCQLCSHTNQRVPPRISFASKALEWIKIAMDKTSTHEGIIDGVAMKLSDDAMRAVVPQLPPQSTATSTSSTTTGPQDLALQWWTAAGGNKYVAEGMGEFYHIAIQQAATILAASPQFTTGNLAIRTKTADLMRAPEHTVKTTIEAAKKNADVLRSQGVIKPRYDVDPTLNSEKSPRLKGSNKPGSPAGNRKEGKSPLGGDTSADIESVPSLSSMVDASMQRTRLQVQTVDRATSPIAKLAKVTNQPKTQGEVPRQGRGTTESKQAIEERAAAKAREEAGVASAKKYAELHAVIEYLVVSLHTTLGVSRDVLSMPNTAEANTTMNAADRYMQQLEKDRKQIEALTALALRHVDSVSLSKARAEYQNAATEHGVGSRVKLLLGPGVDKGIMCDLIRGGESIMMSAEALAYAVHNDMHIHSTKRRLLQHSQRDRLKREVDDSVASVSSSSAAPGQQGAMTPPPQRQAALPPIPTLLAATPQPQRGTFGTYEDDNLFSVRRLVGGSESPHHNYAKGAGVVEETPRTRDRLIAMKWGAKPSVQGLASFASPAEQAYARGKHLEHAWANM